MIIRRCDYRFSGKEGRRWRAICELCRLADAAVWFGTLGFFEMELAWWFMFEYGRGTKGQKIYD